MKISTLFILISTYSFSSYGIDASKLESIRSQFNVPSLSVASIIDGNINYLQSVGLRKLENSTPLSVNDKHHLGSCSKSMTATLAGKLIELGYLKWNSKIKDLLPGTKIHSGLKDVTFELLLAHRSGLVENTEYFSREWYDHYLDSGVYSAKKSRWFLAQEVLKRAPKYKPFQDYKYSNMGYMMAAHILESLTNSNYKELMNKYIFNPLDMKTCGIGPVSNPTNIHPKQPWGHTIEPSGSVVAVHDDNPPAYGPAAAIHCSLVDWGKYLNEHVKGFNNSSSFLLPSTFSKLHMKYPAANSEYTYGGWIRLERNWAGGTVLHHTGTNTYNYANVWIAPLKKSIYMSTTNIKTNGHKATDASIGLLMSLDK
jgi:CubicO group peptidase (beta-lactamase class C family)